MNFIITLINVILWSFVTGIVQILNGFGIVIEFLARDLLELILFGQRIDDFTQVVLSEIYFRMFIIGIFSWVIFFMSTMIGYWRKDVVDHEDTPLGRKIVHSLKYSISGMVTVMFIPMLFWLRAQFISILTDRMLPAFGLDSDLQLGMLMLNIGNPGDSITDLSIPSNISEWNMIVQLLVLFIVLICSLLILFNIIVNIFKMYFHFICTCFYTSMSVFDHGSRMEDYAKKMIANNSIVGASVFVFGIYGSLLQTATTILPNILQDNTFIANAWLQFVLAAVGAIFMVKAKKVAYRWISEKNNEDSITGSLLKMLMSIMLRVVVSGVVLKVFTLFKKKKNLQNEADATAERARNLASGSEEKANTNSANDSVEAWRIKNAENKARIYRGEQYFKKRSFGPLGVGGRLMKAVAENDEKITALGISSRRAKIRLIETAKQDESIKSKADGKTKKIDASTKKIKKIKK